MIALGVAFLLGAGTVLLITVLLIAWFIAPPDRDKRDDDLTQ